MKKNLPSLIGLLLTSFAIHANAAVIISEVAPWGSSIAGVSADWFELTNTGSSALNISGWTMDDDSASFSLSVGLNGLSSIGAGQSVIFVQGTATTASNFLNHWFSSNSGSVPGIGYYDGTGVGLSSSSDAVNIFDATGVLKAGVTFGASTNYKTFDNSAGLTGAITQLSVIGVNGAFSVSNGSVTEIGSPGSIATVAAIPETETYAMLLAGLGLLGIVARRKAAGK